jgi:bifunctional non-homologous end joining protein LigD
MVQRCSNVACAIGLEGVVSKVRDGRYNSGRGNYWVKKTCAQRETLPIAGFRKTVRRPLYWSPRATNLSMPADKVSAKDLQARLKPLIRKTQPYAKKIAHQRRLG